MKPLALLFVFCLIVGSCREVPEQDTPTSRSPESASRIVDLTHPFSEETVYWVTAKEFSLDTVFEGHTEKGYYYSAYNFSTAEHGGTHLDAPIHFAEGRQAADEVPLEKLIGAAVKINVSANARHNPDYLVSIDDLVSWEEKQNLTLPEGAIVLLETGHSRHYPNEEKYLGTAERGEAAAAKLHFPGLDPEAARWLVENRKINAIGIDTPSIDYGPSSTFDSHVILLGENIPVFENLAHLGELPEKGFEVVALPMKIKGGSGAPLRIIALLKP